MSTPAFPAFLKGHPAYPARRLLRPALLLGALGCVLPAGAQAQPAAVQGRLTAVPMSSASTSAAVGAYQVSWQPGLRVTRDGLSVWDGGAGQAFVYAQQTAHTYAEARGMVRVKEKVLKTCAAQTVTQAASTPQGGLTLSGLLGCPGGQSVPYDLTLQDAGEVLDVHLKVGGLGGSTHGAPVNQVGLSGALGAGERVTGGGEQFSTLDLRNRRLPVLVSEQGVGRGEQPVTFLADLTNGGAGGKWYSSYAPTPHLLMLEATGAGRSVWSLDTAPAFLDTRSNRWRLESGGPGLHARLAAGRTPADLTRARSDDTGRMTPLPTWTQSGVIVGVQGGTARVREVYARLKAAGVPVAALWLQDWVGRRTTSFGQQLWWNWELDRERYAGWDSLRQTLADDGVRVLGYVNPFLTDVQDKPGARRNLYREAAAQGYLLRRADGSVYDQQNTSFSAALVDLTNPAAYAWLKGVMKGELVQSGFSGWMADFGESLPLDARPAQGDAVTLHNQYPVLWAKLNQEVIRETRGEDELLVFHRSAFTTSPGVTRAFWAGDQLVNWGADDGLASALTGLLSGGLSGLTLNHADAGGYTTLTQFPLNIRRGPELLDRWLEFSAFTPLFRTHEGNQPAQNAQAYDPPHLAQLARAGLLYAALAPYRADLMRQAHERGTPLMRPVWYDFPAEPFEAQPQRYLLGPDLLVAPVLTPGAQATAVPLPAGVTWRHAWTGQEYAGGQTVTVPSPLGQPAVFVRGGNDALFLALKAVP